MTRKKKLIHTIKKKPHPPCTLTPHTHTHHIKCEKENKYMEQLTAAVYARDVKTIKKILRDTPESIEERDGLGQSVLHHAVYAGSIRVLKVLTGAPGVDVNAVTTFGKSAPLHDARHPAVVAFLSTVPGIKMDVTNAVGNTPLHNAVKRGLDMVTAFVTAGARVNVCGQHGWTPLHIAASGGIEDVAAYLISLPKVDVSVQDDEGFTPFHYSAVHGCKFINTAIKHRVAEDQKGWRVSAK